MRLFERPPLTIFLLLAYIATNGCTTDAYNAENRSDFRSGDTVDVAITLYSDQLYQRIDGFGAFGSAIVPWDRRRLHYSSRFIDDVLNDLGLTISRTQVPTSLEVENDNQRTGTNRTEQYDQFTTELDQNGIAYAHPGDLDLEGFNLDRFPSPNSGLAEHRPLIYEAEYLAALSVQASAAKIPLKTVASVWSPPWWMKYIPAFFGTDAYWNRLSDGVQGDLPRMHEEYAEYCVAYIKLLEQTTRPAGGKVGDGTHLYAFSPQNEPAFGQMYASAVYSAAQYKEMLKAVGQRFKQERDHWMSVTNPDSPMYKSPEQRTSLDFFPEVRIFGPEDVSDFDRIYRYLDAVLTDEQTRKYLDIVAVHGYGNDGVTAGGNAQLWRDTYQIARRYNKAVWQTETSGYGPKWSEDKRSLSSLDLAISMHNALTHGNTSAWLYWLLSDSQPSGYGLMSNGFPNSTYHVSKHFYRFVRPGAIRIGADTTDENLLVSSFYHPDSEALSLILINTDATSKRVTLGFQDQTEMSIDVFDKFVSTRKKRAVKEDIVSSNSLNIEPLSITTLRSTKVPVAINPNRMAFQIHPKTISVSLGDPAEFEAVLEGPFPYQFDFQWEVLWPESSNWKATGEGIPYHKIDNVTSDYDQLRVRLKLVDRDNSERMVTSRNATLNVLPFQGIEIPRVKLNSFGSDNSWGAEMPLTKVVNAWAKRVIKDGVVQLAWDTNFLYIGIKVSGATPVDSTGLAWIGDGIEVFLDTKNTKAKTYGSGHYQWFIGYTNTETAFIEEGAFSMKTNLDKILSKPTRTLNGWQIVSKIPWNVVGVKPRPGLYLGFDVQLVSDQGTAQEQIPKIGLFSRRDDSWKNPSRFGTLRLGQ